MPSKPGILFMPQEEFDVNLSREQREEIGKGSLMTHNPFTFGHPVDDQALFIGRKNEIKQIVNRLLSSAHESSAFIGDSRMGNTSLLKYLANPVSALSHGLDPDSYFLVYLDFQSHPDITHDIFWKRVFTSIYRSTTHPGVKALAAEYRKMGEFDLFDLEDFFAEIHDLEIITVLLMDEFEYVTQSPISAGISSVGCAAWPSTTTCPSFPLRGMSWWIFVMRMK